VTCWCSRPATRPRGIRPVDREDHLRPGVRLVGGHHLGTRSGVGVVGEPGARAGVVLHEHVEARVRRRAADSGVSATRRSPGAVSRTATTAVALMTVNPLHRGGR
jgi:hypothetical protein